MLCLLNKFDFCEEQVCKSSGTFSDAFPSPDLHTERDLTRHTFHDDGFAPIHRACWGDGVSVRTDAFRSSRWFFVGSLVVRPKSMVSPPLVVFPWMDVEPGVRFLVDCVGFGQESHQIIENHVRCGEKLGSSSLVDSPLRRLRPRLTESKSSLPRTERTHQVVLFSSPKEVPFRSG